MKLIEKYENLIYKTQLKLLKLSSQDNRNQHIIEIYKNLIKDLELRIKACEKYGYPYTNNEDN